MKASSQACSATKRAGSEAAMRSTSEPRKAKSESSTSEATSDTTSVAAISPYIGAGNW